MIMSLTVLPSTYRMTSCPSRTRCPAAVRGPDAVRQEVQMYVRAFSDLRFEVEQILSSGEYLTMRWMATGTHDVELVGIPPTYKRVVTHGCTVEDVRTGAA